MNALDASVVYFLNGFAQHSGTFDSLVVLIATNALVKSGPLFAVYWYAWFRSDGNTGARREIILISFLSSFLALLIGRVLAQSLPFRARPLNDSAPGFVVPYGMEVDLSEWSSFPSDHAMFFVALAVGIFALSRRLGWLALAYSFLLVLAPRLYLGLHFATDVLAGAIIGAAVAGIALHHPALHSFARYGLQWCDRHAPSFYTAAFVVTWQMATLFDDLREFGGFSVRVLDRFLERL